ncbi:MAG: circadian clock protein KaiB [Acidimicrobiaceae bacterium]|jgi:circadian clock protein KaiB
MAAPEERFELTLFVSGATDLSARAIAAARALCDLHVGGRYELSVVDVHDDPSVAVSNGVFATPTLVRNLPLPARRVVGDLEPLDRARQALHLPAHHDALVRLT